MSQMMIQRSTFTSLLPLLMNIVEIALTMPISNAWPKRGANRVKLNKTRLKSRMTNEMLGSLLNFSFNGPDTKSSECDSLVQKTTAKWLSSKQYKLSKGKSMTGWSEAGKTSEPAVECTNVSTHTDVVEQEEEQAIIKLGLAQYDSGCD